MVFQHFNLFPHMTVIQNVMEGPVWVRNMPKPEAEGLARKLLAKVGLNDKIDVFPADRSSASPSPARSRWSRR
jgi:polar amino acid transport system ATP-binding protein